MKQRPAVELALDLYRHPALLPTVRKAPLPTDMLNLIRVAASGEAETAEATPIADTNQSELRAAAAFFMQQILFQAGNDHYRILGLTKNAGPQEIKDHKRLLLKWLHPDLNRNKWESAYFQRVLAAAQKIEGGQASPILPVPTSSANTKRTNDISKRPLPLKTLARKKIDRRAAIKLSLKRVGYVAALSCIGLAVFSILIRSGYLNDDLPVFDRLQAWLR